MKINNIIRAATYGSMPTIAILDLLLNQPLCVRLHPHRVAPFSCTDHRQWHIITLMVGLTLAEDGHPQSECEETALDPMRLQGIGQASKLPELTTVANPMPRPHVVSRAAP